MEPSEKDRIKSCWETNENQDPDASTEYLLAITADMCGVDIEDVAKAVFIPEGVDS